MSWEFTTAVDRINSDGGFLNYEAYLKWRERAGKLDEKTITAGTSGALLSEDLANGLLHYDKGYLPLYEIFETGRIPTTVVPVVPVKPPVTGGPGGIGGIFQDLLKNPLLLVAGAAALFFLTKRKKG